MNNPEADVPPTANQPADETDFEILGRVRQLFDEADPMPAGLPGRIRFALALHDLETEMARVAADEDAPVLAVRGEERSRTITFESDSLIIMIRVGANPDEDRARGFVVSEEGVTCVAKDTVVGGG